MIKRKFITLKEKVQEFLRNRHEYVCTRERTYKVTNKSTDERKTIIIAVYVPQNLEFVLRQKSFDETRIRVSDYVFESLKSYVQKIPEEELFVNLYFHFSPISVEFLGGDISINFDAGYISSFLSRRNLLIMGINYPLFRMFNQWQGVLIQHELAHFFDIKNLRMHDDFIDSIDQQYDRIRKKIGNMHAIYALFFSLRAEGIAEFYGEFKAKRRIKIKPKFFPRFMRLARNCSHKEEGLIDPVVIYKKYSAIMGAYGKAIVALIMLHKLHTSNRGFSAWIRKRRLGFQKDHNMTEIADFFEERNYSIVFTDTEALEFIETEVLKLCELDATGFIREYVKAYIHFRFYPVNLTARNYNYFFTMAKANAIGMNERSQKRNAA